MSTGAARPALSGSDGPAGPLIEAEGLAVAYGRRTVWSDAGFSVEPGEFVAVLGPNGAGKTTLLRVLLGLLRPSAGRVAVLGRAPRRGNPGIGYVPQRRPVDPELRLAGTELVKLGLTGTRWGPGRPGRGAELRRRVDDAVAAVGAAGYADQPIGTLSGGELQRLALAQTIISQPRILLLDEPLASLDVRNQVGVAQLVATLARTRGMAVMLIAHDVNPLLAVLDRVIYVARGRLTIGTPDEVITSERLSRLYDANVEVLSDSRGRMFVVGLDDEVAHPHDLELPAVRVVLPGMTPLTALAGPHAGWNPVRDAHQLFQYPFMRHAFVAGTIVAVVAGVVGYFVVLRQSSFAAHALAEIGFAGATGAVAFGFSAVLGLLGMSLVGAALIGALGKRLRGRDAVIGSVLAFSLGLGSYFLTRYQGNASGAFSLLFGEILGISVHDVWFIAGAGVVTVAVMAVLYRPLLFASLDEEVAEARGVPVRALSVGFLLVLAVAVTAAVQVVGVLLIFSLLVVPGAIAERLCRRPGWAVVTCVGSSVVLVWAGLAVTYYTKFPVGFLITTFAFAGYLGVRLVPWVPRPAGGGPRPPGPASPAAGLPNHPRGEAEGSLTRS